MDGDKEIDELDVKGVGTSNRLQQINEKAKYHVKIARPRVSNLSLSKQYRRTNGPADRRTDRHLSEIR